MLLEPEAKKSDSDDKDQISSSESGEDVKIEAKPEMKKNTKACFQKDKEEIHCSMRMCCNKS